MGKSNNSHGTALACDPAHSLATRDPAKRPPVVAGTAILEAEASLTWRAAALAESLGTEHKDADLQIRVEGG